MALGRRAVRPSSRLAARAVVYLRSPRRFRSVHARALGLRLLQYQLPAATVLLERRHHVGCWTARSPELEVSALLISLITFAHVKGEQFNYASDWRSFSAPSSRLCLSC